jgi:hypothetical protein
MKYVVVAGYKSRMLLCVLLLAVTQYQQQIQAQHIIRVNASHVLNDVSDRPVGINLNYLMDGTYLSPAPAVHMQDVLRSMCVKYLRYPGGEKSDNYLWSVAPWTKAAPVVARPGAMEWPSGDARFTKADQRTLKSIVLDFDEFMSLSKSIGAEPILVVAYDAMYKEAATSNAIVPTKDQLLKNAEEWVRYANITKKYGVKYWMIGNESYKNCDYNGCATAAQYRDDIIEFSTRMRKIDPTIKIIANGDEDEWWATVLPLASAHIDFLGLSNYPAWSYTGGYDFYRTNNPDFMSVVNRAVIAIGKYTRNEDKERIKIMVTEFNAIDWSGTWKNDNDLGHALFCFEMLGEHLQSPFVVSSNFWTTRWVKNTTAAYEVNDAINKYGNLNANGKALSIWGNYLLQKMISSTSSGPIRTFSCLDPFSHKLNIFLINKEITPQQTDIFLQNYLHNFSGKRWELSGSGAGDLAPVWALKESFVSKSPYWSLRLPATSITVLELSAIL